MHAPAGPPLGYAFGMRHAKALATVVLALFCAAAGTAADAHPRSRVSIGFYVGAPVLAYSAYPYWHRPHFPYYAAPYYAPYPYYAYPPVVVAPAAPTVYVEQQPAPAPAPAAAAPAAASFWYYCADSNAYYPYVKQCVGPWQPVPPRPPQ